MNKEAINIKNNEGTAAASNKSSEAEIYAVVAVSYTHLTLPTIYSV